MVCSCATHCLRVCYAVAPVLRSLFIYRSLRFTLGLLLAKHLQQWPLRRILAPDDKLNHLQPLTTSDLLIIKNLAKLGPRAGTAIYVPSFAPKKLGASRYRHGETSLYPCCRPWMHRSMV